MFSSRNVARLRTISRTKATRTVTIVCMFRTVAGCGLKCQDFCGRRGFEERQVAQSLPARDLLRQGLGILLATAVQGLRSRHQLRDLQLQLIDQRTGAIISHRAVLRAIGIKLRPVNADNPDLHQLQLLGQKQNLQETLANRREVLAPKGRNRIMVGMVVGGHEAHPDIPVRRALDPAARENPVGIAVNQKRQHHSRVILRRARAAMVHLEGAHPDALDRLDHEVRQIILRDPVPKIGRKQKRLVPITVYEVAHDPILNQNHLKVRQTASPNEASNTNT